MVVSDQVYGKVEINEPIFQELLSVPSFQRLKDISQYGIPDKYYHHTNFSRYDHSIGVMLLLRRLGVSLEEQVAGLLHDVSIFAFSHVANFVFGKGRSGEESYHDSLHDKFIHDSEIPAFLTKYGFSEEKISDLSRFLLLEREAPDLCADRVDYALREFDNWSNPVVVSACLQGLTTFNNEIVFRDISSAKTFSVNFLKLQTDHWGGPEGLRRYHLFSRIIERALELRLVEEKDFYGGETPIVKKLEESSDSIIQNLLLLLRAPDFVYQQEGQKIIKKFRYVDPHVLVGSDIERLTSLDSEYARVLETARSENKKGVLV